MATDADKIKVTILPTGTMHADLTWLLIDPQRMATRSNPGRQKDWVPVPTHVVYIEHPDGTKLLWDAGVPRDWGQRWGPTGLDQYFPVDEVTDDMWLDSRLEQLDLEPGTSTTCCCRTCTWTTPRTPRCGRTPGRGSWSTRPRRTVR